MKSIIRNGIVFIFQCNNCRYIFVFLGTHRSSTHIPLQFFSADANIHIQHTATSTSTPHIQAIHNEQVNRGDYMQKQKKSQNTHRPTSKPSNDGHCFAIGFCIELKYLLTCKCMKRDCSTSIYLLILIVACFGLYYSFSKSFCI